MRHLHRPIFQHQAGDAGEIAPVAGDEDQVMHQGDGSDAQVLAADAQAQPAQLLVLALTGVVQGNDRELLEKLKRIHQARVGSRRVWQRIPEWGPAGVSPWAVWP